MPHPVLALGTGTVTSLVVRWPGDQVTETTQVAADGGIIRMLAP